jgi:ATP-dependent Clp protease ATP-binding subunit ClpA
MNQSRNGGGELGERLEISEPIDIEAEIKKEIVGQEQATQELAKLFIKIQSGVRSNITRPIDSVFLAGPSGVGKTESVLTLARMLIATDPEANRETGQQIETVRQQSRSGTVNPLNKILKIDGGNFQYGHEVATLLGSPHGYLGFDSTKGLLHEQMLANKTISYVDFQGRKRKVLLMLIDEAEKAHEKFHNAFLTILDKGQLTLGDNTVSHFQDAIIFFTSNAGNTEVEAKHAGFVSQDVSPEKAFTKAYKSTFRPEYRGRINKTIVYNHLDGKSLGKIADLQLQKIRNQFLEQNIKLDLQLTDNAKAVLIAQGTNQSEGARALIKQFEGEVMDRLILATRDKKLDGKQIVIDIGTSGEVNFFVAKKAQKTSVG